MPRVEEIPFDSDRKLMTTVHKVGQKYIVYTKGGVDELLACSISYQISGEIKSDLENFKPEIEKRNQEMASDALRVLAFGYKELDHMPNKEEMKTIESNLIFIGMVGMIDRLEH